MKRIVSVLAAVLMVCGAAMLGMTLLGIGVVFWTWFLTNASQR